jgi:hypothetical protein
MPFQSFEAHWSDLLQGEYLQVPTAVHGESRLNSFDIGRVNVFTTVSSTAARLAACCPTVEAPTRWHASEGADRSPVYSNTSELQRGELKQLAVFNEQNRPSAGADGFSKETPHTAAGENPLI